MKIKALVALRSKLFKPCKKIILFFRVKLKKTLFITSLHRQRRTRHKTSKKRASKNPRKFGNLISAFRLLTRSRKMDKFEELDSTTVSADQIVELHETKHFPSPFTPLANVKGLKFGSREGSYNDAVVEDACRSFENYLVEMMVEEGKLSDLKDVEELLYCWKNLKCPVFIDLVCSFYGELCKDLFSPDQEDDKH